MNVVRAAVAVSLKELSRLMRQTGVITMRSTWETSLELLNDCKDQTFEWVFGTNLDLVVLQPLKPC